MMKLRLMAISFGLDVDGRVAFRRHDLVEVEWCASGGLRFCDAYQNPAWSWFDLSDYHASWHRETPEQYFMKMRDLQ
jgi:hypothetical protein